jgi:hypothetical protein
MPYGEGLASPRRKRMKTIYISDKGDDNNDGLTRDTAIYSWKLATKLADGEAEIDMRDASRERINDEIKKARKRSPV